MNRAPSTDQRGGGDKAGIYAAARIQYSGAVTKDGSTANVTSSDVNWTPPPCWHAPYLGAKDFKETVGGGDPRDELAEALVEGFDAVMATFHWRRG